MVKLSNQEAHKWGPGAKRSCKSGTKAKKPARIAALWNFQILAPTKTRPKKSGNNYRRWENRLRDREIWTQDLESHATLRKTSKEPLEGTHSDGSLQTKWLWRWTFSIWFVWVKHVYWMWPFSDSIKTQGESPWVLTASKSTPLSLCGSHLFPKLYTPMKLSSGKACLTGPTTVFLCGFKHTFKKVSWV